jgi:hypothetical protein
VYISDRYSLMGKKTKRHLNQMPVEDELWIAPRYSLKGATGDRAWENRPGGPPNGQRMLELADIALGLKKPEPKKNLGAAVPTSCGRLNPISVQLSGHTPRILSQGLPKASTLSSYLFHRN